MRLAIDLDRPVYDCFYLTLAHQAAGTLVTADARLVHALAATAHGAAVMLLGDRK